jgi:hypothetical protein
LKNPDALLRYALLVMAAILVLTFVAAAVLS